ncbi:MAG TPA: phosphate ABC transporter permease subunit PstC [Actinobacteria bacterium]|jgi:phosphate transport system permease protein|nr:phosphate ABC transporter permease subunit PstC [Actinomycetota bacterium]
MTGRGQERLERHRGQLGDRLFRGTTRTVGIGLLVLLGLLVADLAFGGSRAFARFGLHFLTGTNWNPVAGRESFGALPFIFGTLVTSAIAIILAVPVAVGLALLLNELPSNVLRDPLAVLVDLLAAIPSVVYGLWGLFVLLPLMDRHVEPFLTATVGRIPVVGLLFRGDPHGGDLFTAGVILAIMILPIITAVSREVVATVPKDLREAARALGATRYETVRMSVLPYARSGIVGATMLGLGRALGETIAVALLVGNFPAVRSSLFRPGSTIPSVIANEFREATSAGVHRSALLALALLLVMISFVLAALSRLLVRRTTRLVSGAPAEPPLAPVLQVSG